MVNTSDKTASEHQENYDVLVSLSECTTDDASTVFEVLRRSFTSDRAAADAPTDANAPRPTIWSATVDVSTKKESAGPASLAGPVTLDAQGGYWAVDRLKGHLGEVFSVEDIGTAAGDQEEEVRMRLTSR
ncbi:hypothetical protein [Streptomyces sp. NBC_00102]|uniref:hypothetical protein n=1 Tax=Streptomyces sp. NBC_00102 TaxID=2975652 RepID=UPI002251CA76|nr:hypothetical protein [Streptomyces sp. NBC_00102]MCX5401400.1 hypothetical protein [Streptomyces sp. NBC_00102]